MTISGLNGAVSTSGPLPLGGVCSPYGAAAAVGCGANFSSNTDGTAVGQAMWNDVDKTLTFLATKGVTMGMDYIFTFVVRNPPTTQLAPSILIEMSGAVPITRLAMVPDLATDLSIAPGGSGQCGGAILGAVPGDAAPLKIYPLVFVCPVAGLGCAGYIGHTTFDPGSLNTVTVTLATSTPLTKALQASIVVSNLANALAPPPAFAGVVSRPLASSTQSAQCAALVHGLSLGRTPQGPPGTFAWDPATFTASFYLLEDSLPGQSYTIAFNLTNPLAPQASPLVKIETKGLVLSSRSLSKDPERPPLAITGGFFQYGYPKIGQESPLPAAANLITVTFKATVPMFPGTGTRLTMSGFLGASSDLTTMTAEVGGLTFAAELGGTPRTLRWDDATKTVTAHVVAPMDAAREYVFGFIVRNPPSPQEPPTIYAQVLP